MSNIKPKLSVILPVYNGQEYLLEAIESILSQGFSDFELIIINDGSTDHSATIIEKLEDPRIKFFQQSNKGLAATLNRGISLAKGEYIVRQDQDDISFQSRFQKQVEFLDTNLEVGMVGTAAEIWVGNERTNRFLKHPTDNAVIKFAMLFDNPFVHSSVMLRRSVFEKVGNYSEDFLRQPPEDYELWSRVMREYKLANLPDVLVAYREVHGSMSRTGINPFLTNLIKINTENLAWASGCSLDSSEVVALSKLHRGVYDKISSETSFSKMKTMLNQAALHIAEQEHTVPQQVDILLRQSVNRLRYHYFNYRSGGLLEKLRKMVKSVL